MCCTYRLSIYCILSGTSSKVYKMACKLATSILHHCTSCESIVIIYVHCTSPIAGSLTQRQVSVEMGKPMSEL